MPFEFPIQDDHQMAEAHAAIHALKETLKFDTLLSDVIARRIASNAEVRNYYYEKKRISERLLSIVSDHVNPVLAQAILHENELFGHDLKTSRASALKDKELYKLEASVESAVRNIIETLYDSADHSVYRKKTRGAMNVIINTVHNVDFVTDLRAAGVKI